MKVGAALENVTRLYVEAAPLIYYVEEHPDHVFKMDIIVDAAIQSSIELASSVITLTEVLVHPLKQGNSRLAQEYQDVLSGSDHFRLYDVTRQLAQTAAMLRARYELRTPDALHLATALDAGCDAFLTNDRGLSRVTEITVLILGDLDVSPH
jgi:predicted nucleic acid-binding protein